MVLPQSTIDLLSLTDNCFSRCEVGNLPDQLTERYCAVAVVVFESVLGFDRTCERVSRPELTISSLLL